MVYYIKTTSWNLLESFVSESLSPFSFYGQRDFGNNLSRHSDGISERPNYLILSTKKMKGDYVLKIEVSIGCRFQKVVEKGCRTGLSCGLLSCQMMHDIER